MSEGDMLTALGWDVVVVPRMRSEACVVQSERLVLVRAGVSDLDALLACALTECLMLDSESGPGRQPHAA